MDDPIPPSSSAGADEGFAFLLVQLGFHAAAAFGAALAPLGIEPRHFGLLRQLAAHEGVSQQALGELLGLNPTRMVFLVDDLEQRGLVVRERKPSDRRHYALRITTRGRDLLAQAELVSRRHETGFAAALSADERRQLARLLRRLATAQGLSEQRLPGLPPRGPGRAPAC